MGFYFNDDKSKVKKDTILIDSLNAAQKGGYSFAWQAPIAIRNQFKRLRFEILRIVPTVGVTPGERLNMGSYDFDVTNWNGDLTGAQNTSRCNNMQINTNDFTLKVETTSDYNNSTITMTGSNTYYWNIYIYGLYD